MKDWTIMIYMAGKNNLSDDMVAGLKGIEKCAKIDDGRIAVTAFYDTAAIGVAPVVLDFSDPRFEDRAKQRVSVDSIREFIEWSVSDRGHVARNYAIIFSGHGDGYQKGNFLCDMNARSAVCIADLARMLEEVTAADRGGGFSLGQRFGIIGFDSCVMNTLEVLYELKGVTDFVVGSQGFVPNTGWDYDEFFERLSETQGPIAPRTLAQTMCNAFIAASRPFAIRSGRSIDISAIDLRENEGFDRVVGGIDRLGRMLADLVGDPGTRRLAENSVLASHWKCQTMIFDQAVDIADFCAALGTELGAHSSENQILIKNLSDSAIAAALLSVNKSIAEIRDLCESIVKKVENVAEFHSLGSELQWGSGISLYFPWSYRSFELSSAHYSSYALSRPRDGKTVPGWLTFLEVYLRHTMRPIRAEANPGKKERYLRKDGGLPLSRTSDAQLQLEAGIAGTAASDTKFAPPLTKFAPPLTRFPPNAGSDLIGLANFGRFKNFPWLPVDWDPSNSVLDE